MLLAIGSVHFGLLHPLLASNRVAPSRVSGEEGSAPQAPVIADKAGNLFGTTQQGGTEVCLGNSRCDACFFGTGACGVVFELSPLGSANVAAAYKVLSRFHGGTDGAWPIASLVSDGEGNLYVTTSYGGYEGGNCVVWGCGTVFELKKSGAGWTKTILYTFKGGSDGNLPAAGVIFDATGNLYGTTAYGGDLSCYYYGSGCGVVFELKRTSRGWAEQVLYTFHGPDGADPFAALAFDSAGNLYGTTMWGGLGNGLIFQLVNTNGSWIENIPYEYGGAPNDGEPDGGVVLDHAGNLYGATEFAGDYGYGGVYELSQSQGVWTYTTLSSFNGSDGWFPHAGVILGKDGNIYGTTLGSTSGNCMEGCGVVFMLDRSQGWAETILHSFVGGTDGAYPWAPLLLDENGNVYGTTVAGGDPNCSTGSFPPGCGVVYRISR